ncbi:MAG: DUF4864 domain-containing protein [Pseudomonadota bacterium]|nr:DUF4864 domain-containing protein [Pseudomonadota bacterium]
MKQILLVLAITLATLLPRVMTAQTSDEGAIQGVISSQLDAFIAEDVDAAWTYASPMIQGMFRTPQMFGRMVENGYPMVWKPTATQFLELRDVDGALWQKVILRDGAGVYHVVEYKMLATDDGWLIDGVQLIREAGVGA